jgi:hypothetical protein
MCAERKYTPSFLALPVMSGLRYTFLNLFAGVYLLHILTGPSEQTSQLAVTVLLCAYDYCQANSLNCAVVMRFLQIRKGMVDKCFDMN